MSLWYFLSWDRKSQYRKIYACALRVVGVQCTGQMAYLRPAAKEPDQVCDDLRSWLPMAEFSSQDDAPHMRLCRNVPAHLLQPFQRQVWISTSSFAFQITNVCARIWRPAWYSLQTEHRRESLTVFLLRSVYMKIRQQFRSSITTQKSL